MVFPYRLEGVWGYTVFKSLVGLILALVFSWPGAGLFTLPSWVLMKFFNGVARIQERLESSAHRVPASLVPFQARLWSRGCFFLSFRLPLEEGRDGNSLPFHKGERQRGFQFQFPFPLKYHQGRDDEVERRTQTRLLSTLPSCPQSEPPGSRAPSPAEFQSCGDHWCSLWRRHPQTTPQHRSMAPEFGTVSSPDPSKLGVVRRSAPSTLWGGCLSEAPPYSLGSWGLPRQLT